MRKYVRLKRRLPTVWHKVKRQVDDTYWAACGLILKEKDPQLSPKDYVPYPFEMCMQCARKEKDERRKQ